MPRTNKRPIQKTAAWLTVAAVAWAFFVHLVGPWLVRLAYEERAPFVLSAVLSGRGQHPVAHYVGVWNGVAWKLDLLAAIGVLVYLVRSPVAKLWNRVVHAAPGVGPGGLLSTALLIGLATGTVEGLHIFIRKIFDPLSQALLYQSYSALWMSPIGESVFMVCAGLLLLLVTRAWRRPVSLRLATTMFVATGAYGCLHSVRLGLGSWSVGLLSLGAGVQAGSLVAARAAAFRRRMPAVIAGMVVWVGGAAGLLYAGAAGRDLWALHKLPDAADGPNVVLLILDTVRAKSLSLYGYERPTTPRLQELARESAVVDGAVSVTSWTLPSHASMLTGQFPWKMNVGRTVPMHDPYPTLAEFFSERGYATGGFVANMIYAGRAAGMARGFTHFMDAPVNLRMMAGNSWLLNGAAARTMRRLGIRGSLPRDATNISDAFLNWAVRHGDRPYFAMLNFMDAHKPYESPDSILSRFADGHPLNNLAGGEVYTPSELGELHASYDAAIAYVDQEIGRIVDTLRARGQLDRTILIVTADHGEQLGERDPGLHGHGNSLYASSIDVPLVIRYPAAVPAGVCVRRTGSTRRIPATIMELLGVGGSSPFPGRTFTADFERRGDSTAFEEIPALSVLRPHVAMLPSDPVARGRIVSVRWKHWHYLHNGNGSEELYDLTADPWELEDRVWDTKSDAVLQFLRSKAEVLVTLGVSTVGGSKAASDPARSAQRDDSAGLESSSLETAARSAGST